MGTKWKCVGKTMENPMENSHARSVSQVCGLTSFWFFGNLALKNPQRSHVVLSNYVLKFFCLGFSIIKTYKNIFSHLICNNFQKNHEKPWTTVKNHEKPILFCIKFSSHRCHMSPASQCAPRNRWLHWESIAPDLRCDTNEELHLGSTARGNDAVGLG